MVQKFNIGFITFSYGGNGGISSEVPNIREWMTPAVVDLSRDPRIDQVRIWNLADTPITMTRNRAVLQARSYGIDILVMIDSDMHPDNLAGQPGARPFLQSSLDFLIDHYSKGPVVIGAPYCGPPPHECVYVFRWQNMQSEHPGPDYQLEMYDRHTASSMTGIKPCAALPTGLIMYDMRVFDITEPKTPNDKPWFYYEWTDHYAAEKASTEDVTMTRDLSLAAAQKLGYSPVFCNWDAWAGHWKPKCVSKPVVITPEQVSEKLRTAAEAGVVGKLVELPKATWLPQPSPPKVEQPAETRYEIWHADNIKVDPAWTFCDMGMKVPDQDLWALDSLISRVKAVSGRERPVVLEVGTWAGKSASRMLAAGISRIFCVDTWEGNKNDDGCKVYDGSQGSPWEVFKKNMAGKAVTGYMNRSPGAARTFKDGEFDLIYIDAEHDYDSVKADIDAWLPKTKHVLAGHDYGMPGVKQAVNELAVKLGKEPVVIGNVWWFRL